MYRRNQRIFSTALNPTRIHHRLNENGFSLIEMLIVTGIMGVMSLAMMAMQSNASKANNYLHFQLKRSELQGAIVGQVLNNPNNCACLFSGASTFLATAAATAPGVTLTGAVPTQIGRFSSGPPTCGAPLQPIVDTVEIDGVKAASIKLTKITGSGSSFSGVLSIDLQSTKDVMGPSHLPISIPVSISATTVGANVSFTNCALASSAGGSTVENRSAAVESPTYGGLGGYGSGRSECLGSNFVNGFSAQVNGGVVRLTASCSNPVTAPPAPGIPATGGVMGGNAGGTISTLSCPAGSYANGIYGQSGSYVDTFGLYCQNPATLATSISGTAGSGSGGSYNFTCPAGKYVFMLISTSGARIDSIQAVCSAM